MADSALTIFTQTSLNLIAFIPVDSKSAEIHLPSATATTQALETGAPINDHVILNPTVVEIDFEVSNLDAPFGGFPGSSGVRAILTVQLLLKMHRDRDLHIVVTRHNIYRNMVLLKPEITHRSPYTGAIIGKVTFQQLNFTSLANVAVPIEEVADDVKFIANSFSNFGAQLTEPLENSPTIFEGILKQLGV